MRKQTELEINLWDYIDIERLNEALNEQIDGITSDISYEVIPAKCGKKYITLKADFELIRE